MGELLAVIDARELAEWQALAGMDPFGEDRADWRSAKEQSTLANWAGKVATAHVEVEPYLLKFEERREELDVATKIRGGFARIMAAQNAGK